MNKSMREQIAQAEKPRRTKPVSLGTVYRLRVAVRDAAGRRFGYVVEDTSPDADRTFAEACGLTIESVTVLGTRELMVPPPPPPAPRDPMAPRLVRRA